MSLSGKYHKRMTKRRKSMKRELWKRLIGTGLCCCMTAGLLAGCGTPKEDGAGASGTGDAAGAGAEASGTEAGGASGESGAASGDVETVTMYQMQFNQNKEEAIARIENEMNKILGERYGVNIDLVMLSISDFATQTNLALASDEVDIVSTYSGFNQVMNMADNNQLISLDDYFANASEEMKSQFTQDELDGMTFHGSLYALNRKYLVGGEMRFAMNEEIANELGIDAGGIRPGRILMPCCIGCMKRIRISIRWFRRTIIIWLSAAGSMEMT